MRELKVVSLFTGAGGLDYGFEAAGFRISVAVDVDPDCCKTIAANRPWPVICKDIQKTTAKELLDAGCLRVGDVDLLIGGPPCQPFSKSAYWANGDTKRLGDPRARTLHEYMRCVAELLPTVFVLENVHGISYSGKEEGFRLLEKLTEQINRIHGTSYALSWKAVNAADYGVPQLRTRFFLVGHRDGKVFEFPPPTHGPEEGSQSLVGRSDLAPYTTAWDAIGHLEQATGGEDLRVRGKWADLLPSIPEGENYLWHTSRKGGLPLFGWRTRYWNFLLKLAKNKPSWTIQAQPGPAVGPFHWKNRLLSTREMACLQTFPEEVHFVGARRSVQRQIGNAVPCLLAEVLARAIAQQFFGVTVSGPLRFAIPLRRPIPPPEPIGSVPKKYLHLVGDHLDHPGERKRWTPKHRHAPFAQLSLDFGIASGL